MALKDIVKRALWPGGVQATKLKAGLFAGISLELDPSGHVQLLTGLEERETHPFIRRAFAECQWMVDVGAARGELPLAFAKRGIPAVAAEPDAAHWGLHRNIALNGLAGSPLLEVKEKFVGTEPGSSFVSLDDLAAGRGGRGFIKIDVDGGEADVLRSGTKTLQRKPLFLIETHSLELERECVSILAEAGYQVRLIDNAWWRCIVPEQRPIPHNRWLSAVAKD